MAARVDSADFAAVWAALLARFVDVLSTSEALLARDVDAAVDLVLASAPVALRTPHARRVEAMLERALERLPAGHDARPAVRLHLAAGGIMRGEFMLARRHLLLSGDAPHGPRAELLAAHVALRTGCTEEAAEGLDALEAEAAADPVFARRFEVQRALLDIARGDPDAAVVRLGPALMAAEAGGHLWTAGNLTFCLVEASVARGDWPAVHHWRARCEALLAPLGEHVVHHVLWLHAARAHHAQGAPDAALELATRAYAAAERWSLAEPALQAAVEAAHAERARGEAAAARVWVRRVSQWLPVCARPDVVARGEAMLVAWREGHVRVAPDGTWLERDGQRTALGARPTLQRVLAALAGAAGQPRDVAALFAAGWPGEVATADSERRRVYTAVWQLRRLGLSDALDKTAAGYVLNLPQTGAVRAS